MARIFFTFLLTVITVSLQAQTAARLSLDGEWLFRADSLKSGLAGKWYLDTLDRSAWERVQTPKYWEEYPGLATYDGWGWFFKTFTLDRVGEQLSVHCAGVDDDATVWINTMEVGGHTGYSDPFALDISAAVRPGINSIAILVKDYAGGGGIYAPVTIIPTRAIDELRIGPLYGTPAIKSADWVRDATIYSVYLRSFSPEGTFAGLEKRVPELKNLGVSVLWLLPIHPVGVKNRKGTLGSPYAVKDYYAIDPAYGTMAEFKHLLTTVKKNGMRLIIDLVANHTAWDSKLIAEHPEWFTRDPHGNIIPPNADWSDVADLDYSKVGLRRYMIDMMRWWVKDIGIDGFRCDVAELVPTDFWEEARAQLNRIKPVMMLSEGSLPEHHVRAFDLTYSWNIYDALLPLLDGDRPVALIDQILKNERLQFPAGALRMRFTTNHDKNAWDAPAVNKFGPEGLALATVLVNTIPGVPMIYTGEEVANDRKLSLFEKVGVDWTRPRTMGDLWKSLFTLRSEHKALSRGDFMRVPSAPEADVYAFGRVAGSDKVVVVLNVGAGSRNAELQLPFDRLFPGEKEVNAREFFSGKSVAFDAGRPFTLELEPRGYRVFVCEQAGGRKRQ